jgi:hypothetical protein
MTNVALVFTPRIEACLAAGDVETLHTVLATWSAPELRALEHELRFAWKAAQIQLKDRYRDAIAQSEALFTGNGPRRREDRRMLDGLYLQGEQSLAEVFSEIHSVIDCYLTRTGEAAQ